MRRIPRSLVSYADADQARRRRLPAKWLAAMLITAAVALLAPGATYVTAGWSSTAATATTTATTTAPTTAAGCRGVTQALLPANGFISNPGRSQGGHLWWHRSAAGGDVHRHRHHVGAVQHDRGQVIMWVQYNATAAKTWRVIVYSALHPGGHPRAAGTGGASGCTGPSRICPRCA